MVSFRGWSSKPEIGQLNSQNSRLSSRQIRMSSSFQSSSYHKDACLAVHVTQFHYIWVTHNDIPRMCGHCGVPLSRLDSKVNGVNDYKRRRRQLGNLKRFQVDDQGMMKMNTCECIVNRLDDLPLIWWRCGEYKLMAAQIVLYLVV